MKEIHLTKKDFTVEWFSGTGKGGQHRNKHQNCCRITHIESGLQATGQRSRSRVDNQRDAFKVLVSRIIAKYSVKEERRTDSEVIRNYHAERNEVLDKASGMKKLYKDVVIDGDLSDMIEARRNSIMEESLDG